MSLSSQFDDISIGNEVFGSDGEKVGTVTEIYPAYVTIEKGFFFPTDYFIPRATVQNARDGQVFLAVSNDAALHSSWDRVPEDLETAGRLTGAMSAPTDELIGLRQAGVQEPGDVQKQARAEEDVVIGKEAGEHTEHVADTVRREEVSIEDDPRVEEVNP